MNINPAGNVPSAIAQANMGDAVAITVLKKALAIEVQGAMQLIQALPQVAASNPPNLGNGVDIFA